MSDLETYINETVAAHPVVVFLKDYCPYCHKVKALFKSIGVDIFEVDLEKLPNGSAIQSALKKKTNQSTVPSVWIGQKFVGGNDDTQNARSNGKLKQLLDSAGVKYSSL